MCFQINGISGNLRELGLKIAINPSRGQQAGDRSDSGGFKTSTEQPGQKKGGWGPGSSHQCSEVFYKRLHGETVGMGTAQVGRSPPASRKSLGAGRQALRRNRSGACRPGKMSRTKVGTDPGQAALQT